MLVQGTEMWQEMKMIFDASHVKVVKSHSVQVVTPGKMNFGPQDWKLLSKAYNAVDWMT